MNKKVTENNKESDSKANKAKGLRASAATSDGKGRGAKPMKVGDDPRFAQTVQSYEAGLKALQIHKYDKAKTYFEKVLAGPSPELADRASVHLNTCNQQMSRTSTTFKSPEEQFDYAVSLMNMGDYVTAIGESSVAGGIEPGERSHRGRILILAMGNWWNCAVA